MRQTNPEDQSGKDQISQFLKQIDHQIEQWIFHILEQVEQAHQQQAEENS